MTFSRTTTTENTIGSFNFFDEVMAMTNQQDDFKQCNSSSSSSSETSMNLLEEIYEQEGIKEGFHQQKKRVKRS